MGFTVGTVLGPSAMTDSLRVCRSVQVHLAPEVRLGSAKKGRLLEPTG